MAIHSKLIEEIIEIGAKVDTYHTINDVERFVEIYRQQLIEKPPAYEKAAFRLQQICDEVLDSSFVIINGKFEFAPYSGVPVDKKSYSYVESMTNISPN